VLPSSGDDLAVSHNSDPLGDDVLATVGGHLDVHLSSILLEVGQHFGGPIVVPDAVDFGFSGVYCPIELVDMVPGLAKALVGKGGASSDRQEEDVRRPVLCR